MSVPINPLGTNRSPSTNHPSQSRKITWVALGLLAADIVLILVGLGGWPELTLLSLGIIGLILATSNLAPFKTKYVESNAFTRAGGRARTLAALSAPVVATAVANIPQISYRQGAGFLVALLGSSAIMLALGKALDLKAALANLAVCVAIVVAVYALNAPPGSSSSEKFEHDVKTDVKLKIRLQTVTGQPKESDVGYSCFAILPDTWFRTRPLRYLTLATTALEAEPKVELPYSPLGYVIKAHRDDGTIGKPSFAEVEVKKVLPGESRDVVINVGRESQAEHR
jgi:hypothetical protein